MTTLKGTPIMTTTRDDRIALFAQLRDPTSQQQFWDRVADDVDWTVEGTHPLAGRYHNKTQFLEATFTRLAGVLPDVFDVHYGRLGHDAHSSRELEYGTHPHPRCFAVSISIHWGC